MSPNIDLLTLLFSTSGSSVNYSSPSINQATSDSEHCTAQEDTLLHLEAANSSNVVTKSTLRALAEHITHALRSRFGIGPSGPNKDVVVVMTGGQPLSTVSLPQMVFSSLRVLRRRLQNWRSRSDRGRVSWLFAARICNRLSLRRHVCVE